MLSSNGDRPFTLLLVDPDPLYRLGLQTAIQGEVRPGSLLSGQGSLGEALLWLQTQVEQSAGESRDWLVAIALERLLQEASSGRILSLLQPLRQVQPALQILAFGPQTEALVRVARRLGCWGYVSLQGGPEPLLLALARAQGGQQTWPQLEPQKGSGASASEPLPLVAQGLAQIEATLAALAQQRAESPWFEQLWLAGWERELRASRWLLTQLPQRTPQPAPLTDIARPSPWTSPSLTPASPTSNLPIPYVSAANPALTVTGQWLPLLFDRLAALLAIIGPNSTGVPLEIDILSPNKRQELLATVLRCLDELILEVRLSELTLEHLAAKLPSLLQDLWQRATADFLGRYSTVQREGETLELLPLLLLEQPLVEQSILAKIPGVVPVLQTLVFQAPLVIDEVPYRPESPEAQERLVLLLQNLLLQVANGVMQPVLNQVADVERLKQALYDRRLMSTREIERFRNHLSWKYRVAAYVQEARDIYESRYGLLSWDATGIYKTSIYAPRRAELTELSTVQQGVTLALELRDALAPRFKFLAGWLGSGMVYVLTQVVGRGIGLIGRGVLQGIGYSLQDSGLLRRSSARDRVGPPL